MIFNTDDMKYLIKKYKILNNKYETIEDLCASTDLNTFLYIFCKRILESKCFELESYFETHSEKIPNLVYVMDALNNLYDMEIFFRKLAYRDIYKK